MDCVEKASSTAAKQDRMTANSHQLSSSFDRVLNTAYYNCTVKVSTNSINIILI